MAAEYRQHDGLHRARRPADGHSSGPARPRRRPVPDQNEGIIAGRVERFLYHDGGLKGLSGVSNDVRDLLGQRRAGCEAGARLLRLSRSSREAGALAAAMGASTASCLPPASASTARHPRRACSSGWAGSVPSSIQAANSAGADHDLAPRSAGSAGVVPTDEELMIARQRSALLRTWWCPRPPMGEDA